MTFRTSCRSYKRRQRPSKCNNKLKVRTRTRHLKDSRRLWLSKCRRVLASRRADQALSRFLTRFSSSTRTTLEECTMKCSLRMNSGELRWVWRSSPLETNLTRSRSTFPSTKLKSSRSEVMKSHFQRCRPVVPNLNGQHWWKNFALRILKSTYRRNISTRCSRC